MIPRNVACISGVIGGACWLARYLVGADDGGALEMILRWGGAMWLVIALVALGIGVVRMGNLWLRAIIAVTMVALAWAIISTVESAGDMEPIIVEAVAGALAIGVFLGILLAKRGDEYA